MKTDFKISNEIASRIIDFLYDLKGQSHGWIADEAKKLIQKLEDDANRR